MGKALNSISCFIIVFWTALCALSAIPGFLISSRAGHVIQRQWARVFLALLGIRVKVIGLENVPRETGVVLAPNHQSQIDIMVLASLPIDFKWVSKTEVARIPLIGATLRVMGSYLVRRDRSGHDLNVMKEVEDGLRAGQAVLIFPEGTRTRTGELLPFKKGAFKAAQNAGVPLLPMAITGTASIATPGQLIPAKWGHDVLVRIGKPMPVPPAMDVAPSMEEFRETLVRLIAIPA